MRSSRTWPRTEVDPRVPGEQEFRKRGVADATESDRGRRRERRRHHRPAAGRRRALRHRPHRHHRRHSPGEGPRHAGGLPGDGQRRPGERHLRLRGHRGVRRGGHHRRAAPEGGDEPGRPAPEELPDREQRDPPGDGAFAGRHPGGGLESARRHGADRAAGKRPAEGAGGRDGRRPRFGAHAGVYRCRSERLGRQRPRLRARRARGRHGAAAALLHGRRDSTPGLHVRRSHRPDRRADPEGRRRDRGLPEDRIGLLRPLGGHRRDGGRHPQGQEEDPSLHGLSGGRVRRRRPLSGGAGQARTRGCRRDHRDQAHPRADRSAAAVRELTEKIGVDGGSARPVQHRPSSRSWVGRCRMRRPRGGEFERGRSVRSPLSRETASVGKLASRRSSSRSGGRRAAIPASRIREDHRSQPRRRPATARLE